MAAAIVPRQALPEVRTLLALDEDLSCREVRKKRIALFLRMFEKRKADAVFIWEKVQGGKTLESMFRMFTNAKKSVIIKHI